MRQGFLKHFRTAEDGNRSQLLQKVILALPLIIYRVVSMQQWHTKDTMAN